MTGSSISERLLGIRPVFSIISRYYWEILSLNQPLQGPISELQKCNLHVSQLIMVQLTWAGKVRTDEFVFRPCKENREECQMVMRKI